MLTTDNTVLLLVDIQGKLAHSMHAREKLFENLQRLVKGVRVLELPILWAEQNPKGLGPTIPEVAELFRPRGGNVVATALLTDHRIGHVRVFKSVRFRIK